VAELDDSVKGSGTVTRPEPMLPMPEDPTAPGGGKGPLRRFLPLAVLLACAALVFALDLDRYITFEFLKSNREILLDFVGRHPVLSGFIFMHVYAVVVALSLPGGAVMTIAGGFLFGSLAGSAMVVVAATAGATALFLIAKTSLGDGLRARAGPWMRRMEAGFQRNAMSYLLVLRLVPLFPFFVVNLVPAFLGVSTRTYVIATFFGIMPGSFVYASVGTGLGSIFDSGEEFSPAGILTPEVIVALVGLAVLAMIPVVYKVIVRRRRT